MKSIILIGRYTHKPHAQEWAEEGEEDEEGEGDGEGVPEGRPGEGRHNVGGGFYLIIGLISIYVRGKNMLLAFGIKEFLNLPLPKNWVKGVWIWMLIIALLILTYAERFPV